MVFLRTVIMAILLMPMLVGMTGFLVRSDAVPTIAAAGSMLSSGHESCSDDHSVCSADECCEWGHCVNCTVLPTRPEALGMAPSDEALSRPILPPLPPGRSIRPAQEPPRPV